MLPENELILMNRLRKKKDEPWTLEQLSLYFGVPISYVKEQIQSSPRDLRHASRKTVSTMS